jgi:7-carboxy-7-deazaguanine synthase
VNGPVVDQVRLTEIFLSLQGESTSMGRPTVFVRLTGCPLRCQYCDTEYAFHGGAVTPLPEIINQVVDHGVQHVCITGGEPLAQPGVLPLMRQLCDQGFSVSLETSGAIDIAKVDPRVRRIVDIKTPGSGEVQRNLWANLQHLQPSDEVKFVICSRQDYDWARLKCDELKLFDADVEILFSPSAQELPPRDLADWVVADRLPVRMQVQLHKYLWGDEPGR